MVGQRIDVGDLGIADRDVDEAGVGAHVLVLPIGDRHHGGALGAADLDHALLRLARRRPCTAAMPPAAQPPRAAIGARSRSQLPRSSLVLSECRQSKPPRHSSFIVVHDTLPTRLSTVPERSDYRARCSAPSGRHGPVGALDRHAVFLLRRCARHHDRRESRPCRSPTGSLLLRSLSVIRRVFASASRRPCAASATGCRPTRQRRSSARRPCRLRA